MALILNPNSENTQRFAMTNISADNTAVHTVLALFKIDTTTTTEQFIFGAFNSGGLSRRSGPVYRADQTTKYVAKTKSGSLQYYPSLANAGANFTPGTDWNVFIYSRAVTGGAAGASRRMLNNGTVNDTFSEESGPTDLNIYGGGAWRDSDGVYKGWLKGKIYCIAKWNRVLSIAEENELRAFVKPENVSGGPPDSYVEFIGTGTAANFTSPAGNAITFFGSPTLDTDTPYTATPEIASVNGGAGIRAGSTGNTAQTNSFAGAPTGGTYGGNAITVTAYNATTKVATFSFDGFADGVAYPNPLNNHTLTLTNATETASITYVPMLLPVDHGSVTIAGRLATDSRFLPFHDTASSNGDIYVFPRETVAAEIDPSQPTNFQVYADGSVRAASTAVRTIWRYDITDANFVRIDATVTDGGAVVVPAAITSVGTVRIGGSTPITVSNFPGDITSGTLDGVALTFASNTSITVRTLANGVVVPRPGNRILSLTGGGLTDTETVLVNPTSGYGSYLISAGFIQAINGVAASYLPNGWAAGYYILYPLAPASGKTTTLGDAGVVTGHVGNQSLYLINSDTGLATEFSIQTSAGANSINAGSGSNKTLIGSYLQGAYL